MPTPQQNSNSPLFEPGNLALMSNAMANKAGPDGLNKALQLASVLQTTLDIDTLIEVFSNEVQSLVPHNSISFENHPQQIEYSYGRVTRHRCSYQLVAAGQTLGQLTLSRGKKFIPSETLLLEHLLCSLVYPLRNALMYKNALNAALRDPLTGAHNRAAMNTAMIRETELARRYNTPLSLIALDIDKFKAINDTYGHMAGDNVLKTVAGTIGECIRTSDILFRYGGEEFTVLLSNTNKNGALLLAERVRETIAQAKCSYGEHAINISASLGVSIFEKGDNSESLFEKADTALYLAKAEGRNCVRFSGKL